MSEIKRSSSTSDLTFNELENQFLGDLSSPNLQNLKIHRNTRKDKKKKINVLSYMGTTIGAARFTSLGSSSSKVSI